MFSTVSNLISFQEDKHYMYDFVQGKVNNVEVGGK